MGDTYNITGQVGAVGPQATAENNTFQQYQAAPDFSSQELAEELAILCQALKSETPTPEHNSSIAAIEAAEKAVRDGESATAKKRLKEAGKRALDAATKIGTSVASKAIQAAIGL